ncbi:fibrinogen-binding adhesin SdrG C-terminal domain-containing protein [Staphylococcus aureus]
MLTNIKIYRVPEGYTLKQQDHVNDDLVDVTDEFKNKLRMDQIKVLILDFGDITSAYVVMVKTKFQIQIAKAQHLFKWLNSSSNRNKSVSTGNALGFTNNQSGGAGQERYKNRELTYGKILIKTVFKN